MAAPKPGKKFKYDLDSVLKVRGIKEKKEQEKFAEKQQEYMTEKQKEEEIKEQKQGKENELRNVFKRGPISDFDKVLRRKAHLEVLKTDLDQQIEKVLDSSKKLEEQRAHLVEAMKDKKIMEKHRERKLGEYNKVMRDLEMKFMDEIATQRFKRREE
ncbi:MAG: flagellar export protein FliJ [Candidatus Margulisbacteria bacterium]|nr:flagellar export protein FliJ [Candidatus Margulisiibacteriota bacterium]MBU1616344.1 flagellar export protein FliJ [Candidatus Margulisiibacteriota bacterium]